MKIKLSPVFIPLTLFLLVRINFLDILPRWDSSEYFAAMLRTISELNSRNSNIFSVFNWLNHPTFGFSLPSVLIQNLSPQNRYLPHITLIIFSLIAVYSFYKISQKVFPEAKESEIILLTTLLALNPSFVANSISFTPDFALLAYLLSAIALFYYDKFLLGALFGVLLVFTKEIGFLAYSVFSISYTFINWPQLKNKKGGLGLLLLPIIIFLLFLLSEKGIAWKPDSASLIKSSTNCRFCFRFSLFNIKEYLKLFLLLNFNWLTSLVIIFGFLQLKLKLGNTEKYLIPVLAPTIAVLIFFVSFIIYVYTRYGLLYLGGYLLFFYYFLEKLIKKFKHRVLFLSVLILLYTLQIFKSYDPVSNRVFGTYSFGKHRLVKIGTEYLGDGLIYNTEYVYIQRLIDKFITNYNINENDNLFIDPYAWGNFKTGFGHFSDKQPNLYFQLNNIDKLPKRLYYLSFPLQFYDEKQKKKLENPYIPKIIPKEDVLNKLTDRYKVDKTKKIEINGYYIFVYSLTAI